jgi:hypothetical protein
MKYYIITKLNNIYYLLDDNNQPTIKLDNNVITAVNKIKKQFRAKLKQIIIK